MKNYKDKIKTYFDSNNKVTYLQYLKHKFKKYKYICAFGAGNVGQGTVEALKNKGIKVDFFCDNNKSKVDKEYKGIKCISVNELINIKDDTLVIICTRFYKEIYEQMTNLGINNIDRIFINKFDIDSYISSKDTKMIINKFISVIDILEDDESKRILTRLIEEWNTNEYTYGKLDDIYTENQYFCNDIVNLSNNEVFVDGGAYNGDTVKEFLTSCNYEFDKLLLFELNRKNYDQLVINTNLYESNISSKIKSFNLGLSDKEKEVYYSDEDEGSSISQHGTIKSKVTNIDNILKDEDVTFIKMDIEGAELEALIGAQNTIKRCTPKLAICLYHKPQDLWQIPLFIKDIEPSYKIYIRHHTDLLNETVCYAIPR